MTNATPELVAGEFWAKSPGVNWENSLMSSITSRSICSPVNAVTANGADWSDSSRRRAVTTTSSTMPRAAVGGDPALP